MATLDATPGGASANAYVTVAGATTMLHERLGTEAWDEADATAQAQSLMWATQLLEEQVVWYGTPTTMTQALAWPQTGQIDHMGRPIPSTIVPMQVQRATATYALALLGEDAESSAPGASAATGGIKSRKVGDMTITYQDVPQSAAPVRPVTQGIPAEVRAMLRPYAHMSGSLTVRLLRT
jgi:hypothetical protein